MPKQLKTQPKRPRGRPKKTLDEHRRDGTFRPVRHRGLLGPAELCHKPPIRLPSDCGDWRRWIQSAADERAASLGYYFDERLADYVVEWFAKFLCHSKGRWAGKPFELLDWQRDEIIKPIFGWLTPTGFRRFTKTYIEIAKKNGKSTLASGIGLYMLCGDGEQGAEVYSCASDKNQASIVHGEAINMVDASPALSAALKINRSNRTIHFPKTKSVYRSLSSNPAGQQGLNSVCNICDELHCWRGRQLWEALKYAGRARSQPLDFVITTAGNEDSIVCQEQHDFAKAVLNGTFTDDDALRFFAYILAADPSDDFNDPAVWKQCNPSLRVMIDPLAFAADVKEGLRSPSTRASLLRYSFNIWGTSEIAWLDQSHWSACARSFSEADLKGRPCWAGLDLAKSRDLTALALVFPDERSETFQQLVYYFMPRETAVARNDHFPFLAMAKDGWITLTPGAVCDYGFVRKRFRELSEQFDIRELAYDPWNAEETTQHISEGVVVNGETIEEGSGIPRILFKQSLANLASPTAEYERLIISSRLFHNNNPVLNWQAQTVQVYCDANGNRRPVKRKQGDHRSIDGIVAGIMALARAMQGDGGGFNSVYETRGILSLDCQTNQFNNGV